MSKCNDSNLKECYHKVFCDTRDCKVNSSSLTMTDNFIKDNKIKIYLDRPYTNVYSIEPVNVVIPHNMIPFRLIAPESEWVTYKDAFWVSAEDEGDPTPWGPSSSSSLQWVGDFKLYNYTNKSLYDIPILAFAFYDGPFCLPETVRKYIKENENFQRALLHPFEQVNTNDYSNDTQWGYKNPDIISPLTLKYVVHSSQSYSGVQPIINSYLLEATFKDSTNVTTFTFIEILLKWAEHISNNCIKEDVHIELSEVQVYTNNKSNNKNSIISIPLRSHVDYMDGTISLVSGELGLWKNIFNPIKASLASLTLNFYSYHREKLLLEPLLNGSIFSTDELPAARNDPSTENFSTYKMATSSSWMSRTNSLSRVINVIFKIVTLEKENTEHCLLTNENGLREKHRKWDLSTENHF